MPEALTIAAGWLNPSTFSLIGVLLLWQKVSHLETRMDRLEAKVDGLEAKVNVLEAKVNRLEVKMDVLEAKADRLESKVDRLEAKMDQVIMLLVAQAQGKPINPADLSPATSASDG